MKYFKNKKVIITCVFLALVAMTYYIYSINTHSLSAPSVWEKASSTVSFAALNNENSNKYELKEKGFSFLYPKNLKYSSIPNDDNQTILIFQDSEKGQGFQIMISPFDEQGSVIDAARIHNDIPDLKIEKPEDVLLGPSGKGVAFLSDNEAFGNNSREVWFVYKGYLYQISTYAHLDPLLQSVLATWNFE